MKKQILAAFALFFTTLLMAQNVQVDEKSATFNAGSKNAIVISIPYVTADFMEKKVKDEVKEWGGKYNSSKGEYSSTQGQFKPMGEKPFDGYAKIIESKEGVSIAFAFDLGGAYMNSSDHKAQYTAMVEHLKEFALNAAKDAVNDEIKTEEKALKKLQEDQKDLESDKASLEKSIEEYKNKIAEAEKKIEQNKSDQEKKKSEIKTQEGKVEEVNKKLKGIK